MAIAKRSRKQIEQHIAKCAESIQKNGLEIGRDLIEIRDHDLWADEYESWNQYLKDRATELVSRSFVQSAALIRSAEIDKKIPDSIRSTVLKNKDLPHTAVDALGPLAPSKDGNPKHRDYSKLRKQDVARVLKSAVAIADSETPSVRDIRQAVDQDLGVDRKAEAAKRAEQRKHKSQIDLDDYLRRIKGTSEGWLSVLEAVPSEAWEDYASEIDEAATALESLANFLRS